MKKFVLLALTALIMVGCEGSAPVTNNIYEFSVKEVDGCEYLYNSGVGGYSYMAHKGNCRFCKERRKKELEELIIKLKEK